MSHAEALAPQIPSLTAVLFGLKGCLVDFGLGAQADNINTRATCDALDTLHSLQQQNVPCAWLDEQPTPAIRSQAGALPVWIKPTPDATTRWPSPHACWHALMHLNIQRLDGCVLVSSEPQLLQSGLNAGLWTIGLASSASTPGVSQQEQELQRAKTTLQLFSLGVHSVIDHLGELGSCLDDIGLRRLKGEKP